MVLYRSSRGGECGVSFETAVTAGYAADGGLYVPEVIPRIDGTTLLRWSGLNFQQLAMEVLSLFVGGSIGASDLQDIVQRSFDRFDDAAVIPVVGAQAQLLMLSII
jgi:threonine synthase